MRFLTGVRTVEGGTAAGAGAKSGRAAGEAGRERLLGSDRGKRIVSSRGRRKRRWEWSGRAVTAGTEEVAAR